MRVKRKSSRSSNVASYDSLDRFVLLVPKDPDHYNPVMCLENSLYIIIDCACSPRAIITVHDLEKAILLLPRKRSSEHYPRPSCQIPRHPRCRPCRPTLPTIYHRATPILIICVSFNVPSVRGMVLSFSAPWTRLITSCGL